MPPMKLSVVTTLFHSEHHVDEFHARMVAVVSAITDEFEIIYVNDGSPDNALMRVLALQLQDRRVVAVDLSRNFGHHRALMTGLQQAQGDHVFMIDSDLEEAPELLTEYWATALDDVDLDVVYGVQGQRKGAWFERLSGRLWYRLFALLSNIDYPADGVTARLMARRYVDAVVSYPETQLELWGIFVLAGFEQRAIQVAKSSKGTSTYSFTRKLRMMIDSVTSFSSIPLVASFILGLIMTAVSFGFIIWLLVQRFVYDEMIEGWTSTLISIWFIGGLILFSLGIIGIYLAKMFLEIKNRPLTVIRKIHRVTDG
jgi:putative glycosyltransferase